MSAIWGVPAPTSARAAEVRAHFTPPLQLSPEDTSAPSMQTHADQTRKKRGCSHVWNYRNVLLARMGSPGMGCGHQTQLRGR